MTSIRQSLIALKLIFFDVIILTVITWSKFHFIFPKSETSFVFSGDFVRPILRDAAYSFYIYPYIFNEHFLFLDPTFPFRIPYWYIILMLSNIFSLNVTYWILILLNHIIGGLLISSSIRSMLSKSFRMCLLKYLFPIMIATIYLYSYPTNYRPYWLFLPLLPSIMISLWVKLYNYIENYIITKRLKISNLDRFFLLFIGYFSILQPHLLILISLTIMVYFLFFVVLLFLKNDKYEFNINKYGLIKAVVQSMIWYYLPALVLTIYFVIFSFFVGKGVKPAYVFTADVLKMMSKNANMINAFLYSNGFWEKVIYSSIDKMLFLFLNTLIFVFVLAHFIKKKHFKQDYLHILALLFTYLFFINLELGSNSLLYIFFIKFFKSISWVFRDPFKIAYISLSLALILLSLTSKNLIFNYYQSGTRIKNLILILLMLVICIQKPNPKIREILTPSEIPKEYFEIINILNKNSTNPILFLPDSGKYYLWSKNRYLNSSFSALSYKGIPLGLTITKNPFMREFLVFLVYSQNIQLLDMFFEGIFIDKSLVPYNLQISDVIDSILMNDPKNCNIKLNFKLAYSRDYIRYFVNPRFSMFNIFPITFFIYDSIDYSHVSSIRYLSDNISILFLDFLGIDMLKKSHKDDNLLVISLNSDRSYPQKVWSIGYTSDQLHGVWHYHIKKFGIKNWQSDYGYGLVFTWAKNTKLENPFTVDKSDKYKLLIRYFKNQRGGEIEVYLDGKPIEIKTKNQLNKFVWEELGTFYLEKGKHEIVLENGNGFNAVNLIVLIPEKRYHKIKKDFEKNLQKKTIIYLLEAEYDLYRGDTKVPDIIFENGSLLGTPKVVKDPELSNGEGLEFYPDHKAWQTIEIVKEGYYRLGLRLKGEFAVKIGNFSFNISSPLWDTKYTPPFYLKKGKYYLQITPRSGRPLLDVVYLFSVPKDKLNATFEDLFKVKEPPAQIKEFKKINPTLWKVKVKADKPFMLSFAEAYDPLWEARIYKNGKKVKTVKSIPLYGVINGFWIDETGDLEIVIRYKPQDWFEIGLAISSLTFLGCIGYLVYDWRRDGR